jgi:hypothetical protein
LAHKKVSFSALVDFTGKFIESGKKLMESLLPDVPHTIEKREGSRTRIQYQIMKTGGQQIESSVDPILIEYLLRSRPTTIGNHSFVITKNDVFTYFY